MRIDHSFYGLPEVAFGGYVAGVLARELGRDAKVDFLNPTPLGKSLTLHRGKGEVNLTYGKTMLASARPHESGIDPPPRIPEWDEALAAVGEYLVEAPITHPNCFGCGIRRQKGNGLQIYSGLSPRGDLVAAAWRPDPAFGENEQLRNEFVWAALDCPSAWARIRLTNAARLAMTAYLAARVLRPVQIGERHIVVGWLIKREGRKTHVGSAIATQIGDICATGEALWLDVDSAHAADENESADRPDCGRSDAVCSY